MLDDDGGHHESMFILTRLEGRGSLISLNVWFGGSYAGEQLDDGRNVRPVLQPVPISHDTLVIGVVERDGEFQGLKVRLLESSREEIWDHDDQLKAWFPTPGRLLDEIADEDAVTYAALACPPDGMTHIRTVIGGVSGLLMEIVGWSVDDRGNAYYGLVTDVGIGGVRIIGAWRSFRDNKHFRFIFEDGDQTSPDDWRFDKLR